MSKSKRFFFVLLVLSLLLAAPTMVFAQDDAEVDVMADVVMPRLEEYGALIPELDHYNIVSVEGLVELLAENELGGTDFVILDVREPEELENDGIIDGAINIPIRELGYNLGYIPRIDGTIIVVCKAGSRATIAMTALHILGYENAMVLKGGFNAWAGEEMPVDGMLLEDPFYDEVINGYIGEEFVQYMAEYLENLPEGWGLVAPNDFFEESFEMMPDMLLDVRSAEEWADPGYIEDATHIWINEFGENLDMLPEDLDANIVVYCGSGYRAAIIQTYMGVMGYTNVRNLKGGVGAWIAAELPLVQDM